MEYLSLNVDGQWAYLDEGTEIALEGNNPIFSDAGSKSYLFRLHVESNRHIFGNSDDIYGESYYKAIDGKRSILYIMGIPVMAGKISLEDEVYMDEDGYIAVNLVSGNLEFAQMIEGMNCRDVEQAEDVVVGYKYTEANILWKREQDNITIGLPKELEVKFELPDEFTVVRNPLNLGDNVVHPYPQRKYCTIRTAFPLIEDDILSKDQTAINKINTGSEHVQENESYKKQIAIKNETLILESAHRNTGICFYVNYFLDCLFKKLGFVVSSNSIVTIEDANRLAFVNLRCKTEGKPETEQDVDFPIGQSDIGYIDFNKTPPYYKGTGTFKRYQAIATSDNFPDVDVAKIIDTIYACYGAKIIANSTTKELRIVLLKDVLSSIDSVALNAEIFDVKKVDMLSTRGFRLRYDCGEEDSNYYLPPSSSIKVVDSFSECWESISSFDKRMFIDSRNGNAYMIKVESEADSTGDEKNLNPVIFEVGSFSPALYGDVSTEERVEEVVIPFLPIINNDVNSGDNEGLIKSGKGDSALRNEYALYVDEVIEPSLKKCIHSASGKHKVSDGRESAYATFEFSMSYFDFLGSNSDSSSDKNWHPANAETMANSYDLGFMLGIMRGPGNEAGIEYYDQGYDGEGNSRVSFSSANYAFTSDSIDNCDRDFDYDGAGSGGVDHKGRFSLKLRAGKFDKEGNPITDTDGTPIPHDADRANRGLYDKFWKEYAYFTVNKKILRLTCRMEIADLVSIDWTKRYRIGEHVGFIASYSYSVNTQGMSDVEMDLYYI